MKSINRVINVLMVVIILFSGMTSTGVKAAAVQPTQAAPAAPEGAALTPASAGPTNPPLLLKDVNSATKGSIPYGKFSLTIGGTPYVLFFADNGVHGTELWKSDGTEAHTSLVKDINPGSGGTSTYGVQIVDGKAYFIPNIYAYINYNNFSVDVALWVTDGTEAGTHAVAVMSPGVTPLQYAKVIGASGTKIYMGVDDGTHGQEPFVYDTATPTTPPALLYDTVTGSGGTDFYGSNTLGGTTYFWAWDGDDNANPHNYILWKTQGTPGTTAKVLDGTSTAIANTYRRPMNLPVLGSYIYFNRHISGSLYELWRTDGTPGGTTKF